MKGWFDAFRNDGGPTLYSYSNRTPVTGDVPLVIVFVIFGTILTAFLVIFPGIRKERLTTFLTVTSSLFVGATIQVCQYGSSWHTSSTVIASSYSAFSGQRTTAEIGGYIGLMHINITYSLLHEGENARIEDVEYNEQFWWRTSGEMKDSFKLALRRGVPFPIISLAEYFSLRQEGFSWGSEYRKAGYYASIMLWSSFASWVMMNLLLMVVPRYGAYYMILTGVAMLLTNLIYWSLLPTDPLTAHVDGSILAFDLGWNYWLVLIAGVGCLTMGAVITALDLIFPHRFSTILEVDYDTPYDRHVIIEESFDTRNVRRKLTRIEDSLGDRIMSQLSSKLQGRSASAGKEDTRGVINRGFVSHEPADFSTIQHDVNDEPSKSNWSYPFPPAPRRIINN